MKKEIKFLWEWWSNNPQAKRDKKYEYGDCVIRAIGRVTGMGWYELYDLLTEKGFELCDCWAQKQVYEAVLKDLGFVWVSCPRTKGVKAMYVAEFIKKHEKGSYILRLAHHLTAVVDGCCYDVWYPQNDSVYGYWTKIIK